MSAFQSKLDFYQILNLDRVPDLTQQDIKAAYRKALLLYHPDKKQDDQSSQPTVDEVALAYKVLSDKDLRRQYDQELASLQGHGKFTTFHTGLETVDLDDMSYNESTGTWHRTCRCTHDFVVTEAELEANSEDGELITGCRGCSLWLRVLYSTEG